MTDPIEPFTQVCYYPQDYKRHVSRKRSPDDLQLGRQSVQHVHHIHLLKDTKKRHEFTKPHVNHDGEPHGRLDMDGEYPQASHGRQATTAARITRSGASGRVTRSGGDPLTAAQE